MGNFADFAPALLDLWKSGTWREPGKTQDQVIGELNELIDPGLCLCGRPEAEPGAGYCEGFLSRAGPCSNDPVAPVRHHDGHAPS